MSANVFDDRAVQELREMAGWWRANRRQLTRHDTFGRAKARPGLTSDVSLVVLTEKLILDEPLVGRIVLYAWEPLRLVRVGSDQAVWLEWADTPGSRGTSSTNPFTDPAINLDEALLVREQHTGLELAPSPTWTRSNPFAPANAPLAGHIVEMRRVLGQGQPIRVFSKPLPRVFPVVLGESEVLTQGDHMQQHLEAWTFTDRNAVVLAGSDTEKQVPLMWTAPELGAAHLGGGHEDHAEWGLAAWLPVEGEDGHEWRIRLLAVNATLRMGACPTE